MKFFKRQSGDGPNVVGVDHFVSLRGSHCNLTPGEWGSSNSLPNPISSDTNPEPLSERERSRALTSSPISFWNQTAPRGGKSVEDEDLRLLTLSGERYCQPTSQCSRFFSCIFVRGSNVHPSLPSTVYFCSVLEGYNPST